MKKNKILKICIMFICMFSIFVIGNNVYGYELKYKAYSNGDFVYFMTMGNAYGAPPPTPSFEKNQGGVSLRKEGVYQSYKMLVQSNALSKYSNSSNSGYNFTYAATNGEAVVDKDSALVSSSYATKYSNLIGKNNASYSEIFRNVSDIGNNIVSTYTNEHMETHNPFYPNSYKSYIDFAQYQERVIAGPSDSGQTIMITKWRVTADKLKSCINQNQSMYLKQNDKGNYIIFSLPCIIHNANTSNSNYIYLALDTAYDAILAFNKINDADDTMTR